MAYIGNTVQNQGFTPAIDYFSGNGSTVTFTLSRPIASVAQMIVAIDNVIQNPSSAFTVSGNSITFTSAPLSGTNNIWVEYTSLITTYAAISQDPSVIGDITASGGYLSTGDFGNTYTDGTIVDYVTGNARITTGAADAITFYNGGTASRTAVMTLGSTGNVGIGTTSPNATGYNADNTVVTIKGNSAPGTAQLELQAYGTSGNDQGLGFVTFLDGTSRNAIIQGVRASSTTSAYIAFATRDGTTLAERMRINASGYVTTPYQPHISGSPGLGSVGANGIADRFAVRTATGLSFSSSRITVPVAGAYMITFQTICQSSTGRFDTQVYVNGSVVSSALNEDNGVGYHQRTHSIVLTLAANDYIQFANTNWYTTGNSYDNFQNASVTLLG